MNLESFEVGFNIPAKVGMDVDEIQTPSLIIDYKIFENNILKMKEFVLNNNVKLRPHDNMHISVDVSKYHFDFGGAHEQQLWRCSQYHHSKGSLRRI